MIVALFIMWGIIGYLACRVAYNQGRKEQWAEVARDYICFHKSVLIQPNKPLDKRNKKRYHKHVQPK